MAGNNMQDIKRRIKSVTSTEHITNAMKLVSSAKFRRAKATFDRTHGYLTMVTDTIQKIINSESDIPDTYLLKNKEIRNTCYVIISSSRGLCGGFNSNIMKDVEARMAEHKDRNACIVAIGSKGKDYFAKRGYDIIGEFVESPETITFQQAQELGRMVTKLYKDGTVDEVVIVYTAFKSTLEYVVTDFSILPFDVDLDRKVKNADEDSAHMIEFEPSPGRVFEYMVPKYVELQIYNAVIESATCEHAARRMAMENATDNANEMLGQLSLYYNRARQAAITNELVEIVAGSEALK